MVFLQFHLGAERYLIDAKRVIAVIPRVAIKAFPQTPPGLVGALSYRGAVVPVVDLCLLALERPASRQLSTRIMLVQYADRDGHNRTLGLMAEQIHQTLRRNAEDFVDSGVDHGSAPYLGAVADDPAGMLQQVQVDELLTPALRDVLFPLGAT